MTTKRRILCSCVFLICLFFFAIFCASAEAQSPAANSSHQSTFAQASDQSTTTAATSTTASPQSIAAPASIPTFATPQKRVTQAVDDKVRVTLSGNVHPLATSANDKGAAPDSLAMERMMLVLQRSPQQEQSLQQLLEAQQARNSPSFHQWLTPEQFGAQFGVHDDDIAAVSAWLGSHGFRVTKVSASKMFVEFSGTAAQVRDAFATEIHQFNVSGEDHWANVSEPQIPAALAPVIAGVHSLNSFRKKPMNRLAGTFQRGRNGMAQRVGRSPDFTISCFEGSCYVVGPYDLATIYNLLPLWNGAPAIDGTGQTIAIVSRSNINPNDSAQFRSEFSLPPNTLNVIVNGNDPGLVQGDETEADLDTQWSGAVAKGATIDLVATQSTTTADGVDLSAEYIVDNNLAPVMSESYGLCELFMGTAGNSFYNTLWQQAAAQGISVFVSSGDQGSAGCDVNQGTAPQPATFGLQVSGIASTPYNVAVGGTDFIEALNAQLYWNATNDPTTQESARGYIPETTWNDSCANPAWAEVGFSQSPVANCNNSQLQDAVDTVGGSGGKSSCTTSTNSNPGTCAGGYAKPYWQTGTGVPADGARDLPDVSMFASNGFQGSYYYICELDAFGSCPFEFGGIGGTSASSPVFAGILALVNQATGSRQGNPNPVLYGMAAQQTQQVLTTCNSTIGSSPTCVFNDVTDGTIAMPCATGSANCSSNFGQRYGILTGYTTTVGYDLATGLGSVNINNLVKGWTAPNATTSTTTLTLNSGSAVNISHGANVTVSVMVGPNSPQPTGEVILVAAPTGGTAKTFATYQLTNGGVAATTDQLPGGNSYSVTAHYAGDKNYAPSDSQPVQVTVGAEGTATSVGLVTFDPVSLQQTSSNATTVGYNTPYVLSGTVTGSAGNKCLSNQVPPQYPCPTGSVAFTDNSVTVASISLDNTGLAENAAEVTSSSGSSVPQAPVLTTGVHNLAANYGGDNSYSSSASSAVQVTVTKAPTKIVLEPVQPSQPIVGQFTSFPFLLTSGPGSIDGQFPTGNFTVFDGATALATQNSGGDVGFVASPPGSRVGTFQFNGGLFFKLTGTAGQHSLTIQYNGDANYTASTSPPLTVNELYSTTTNLSSSNNSFAYGQSTTLTANVTPSQNASAPPSGTVTFTDEGLQLGTANISNGQAQLTTNQIFGGNQNVSATYNGDSNYAASSGNASIQVTSLPVTATLSAPTMSPGIGSTVTFTETISSSTPGPRLPGGEIFVFVNNNLQAVPSVTNGTATFSLFMPNVGQQVIRGDYKGDGDYATASASITETVQPDFSVSATSVVIGGVGLSGMSTVSVSSTSGFSGTVTLSCSVTTPPAGTIAPQCGFTNNQVMLSSTVTTASAVMTVVTTTGSNAVPIPVNRRPPSFRWFPVQVALVLLALTLLSRWNVAQSENQLRRRAVKTALVVLAALIVGGVIDGCGGGASNGSGGGGSQNTGTTPGFYSVNVTATSGTLVHSTVVQVNVE